MRVLWFSISAPVVEKGGDFHNGGGWMQSLAMPLAQTTSVSLGIAYEGCGTSDEEHDGIRLYPINCFCLKRNKLKRIFSPCLEEALLLQEARRIIVDFQPDVIHIWGTESAFGLVAGETSVPCILHVQGVLAPYYNALFPPGFNRRDLYQCCRWHLPKRLRLWMLDRMMRYRAERERRIFKVCRNYLGRTEWDKALVHLASQDTRYFHCSEMLRVPFGKACGEWKRHEQSPKRIISVLSMPTYKGHDLILKTAKLLKEHCDADFSWDIYGVWSMAMWEKHLRISCREVDVIPCGTVDAETLRDALMTADVFVHPSYIDNSPNSLCEAQLLGLPIIATYVGGVPSLVVDGETGLLVPANEPFMLAERIREIFGNPSQAEYLGRNAAISAEKRHEPKAILRDLLDAYNAIMD